MQRRLAVVLLRALLGVPAWPAAYMLNSTTALSASVGHGTSINSGVAVV